MAGAKTMLSTHATLRDVHTTAQVIKSMTPDDRKNAYETLLIGAPIVETGKKKTPMVTVKEKSIVYTALPKEEVQVEASLATLDILWERYQKGYSGTYHKATRANSLYGIPGLSPYAHVLTLLDAGVTKDSRILVDTADSNMIAMLRSNFSDEVFGVGTGKHCLLRDQWEKERFDYVYFPKKFAFKFNSKKIDEVVTNFKNEFTERISQFSRLSARVVFHVPPVALCSKFLVLFLKCQIEEAKEVSGVKQNRVPIQPTRTSNLECLPLSGVYEKQTLGDRLQEVRDVKGIISSGEFLRAKFPAFLTYQTCFGCVTVAEGLFVKPKPLLEGNDKTPKEEMARYDTVNGVSKSVNQTYDQTMINIIGRGIMLLRFCAASSLSRQTYYSNYDINLKLIAPAYIEDLLIGDELSFATIGSDVLDNLINTREIRSPDPDESQLITSEEEANETEI